MGTGEPHECLCSGIFCRPRGGGERARPGPGRTGRGHVRCPEAAGEGLRFLPEVRPPFLGAAGEVTMGSLAGR